MSAINPWSSHELSTIRPSSRDSSLRVHKVGNKAEHSKGHIRAGILGLREAAHHQYQTTTSSSIRQAEAEGGLSHEVVKLSQGSMISSVELQLSPSHHPGPYNVFGDGCVSSYDTRAAGAGSLRATSRRFNMCQDRRYT